MARAAGMARVAFAVLAPLAAGAAAPLPGLSPAVVPGSFYATARAELVAAGYKPFRVLRPGSDAFRVHIFNRSDVYRRYKEVEGCAGTGAGDCNFILARGRRDILVVHTVGEAVPSLVVKDARRVTAAQANAFYPSAFRH